MKVKEISSRLVVNTIDKFRGRRLADVFDKEAKIISCSTGKWSVIVAIILEYYSILQYYYYNIPTIQLTIQLTTILQYY